jgi:hypothetical protein
MRYYWGFATMEIRIFDAKTVEAGRMVEVYERPDR